MSTESAKKPFYKDPTHMLYLSVIAAVILGCILGMTVPDFAKRAAAHRYWFYRSHQDDDRPCNFLYDCAGCRVYC